MTNPFFKNTGPYDINHLLKSIDLKGQNFLEEKINDIKDLYSSQNGDITFFHSKKYNDLAKTTKASYCITTENLKSFLPNTCKAIISDKVLLHTAQITKIFYPDSVTDDFDNTAEDIKIEFTGLRPGEKLLEEILHDSEPPQNTHYPGIMLAAPRTIDLKSLSQQIDEVVNAATAGDTGQIVVLISRYVPEFQPEAVGRVMAVAL